MKHKEILRMLDVNLNRSREGLRVVEDYYRFICQENGLRQKIRSIRHALDSISADKKLIVTLIAARNTKNDLGKEVDCLEMNRTAMFDVIYANFQRAKESLRVLEELFKIIDKKKVGIAKRIRYQIYAAEKDAFGNQNYLCYTRQRCNRKA